MKIFKRKKKQEEIPKELPVMISYIEEARKLMWKDEEIIKKFLEKEYPEDLIEKSFAEADTKLPLKKIERRIKMIKEKEEEDFDEDEEDFEDEESEDEAEEKEEESIKEVTPKKIKKEKKKVEEPKELTKEQTSELFQQVVGGLKNHEDRLTTIEASLFRLKGSI